MQFRMAHNLNLVNLLFLEIFIIFLDIGWMQVIETTERKYVDMGGPLYTWLTVLNSWKIHHDIHLLTSTSQWWYQNCLCPLTTLNIILVNTFTQLYFLWNIILRTQLWVIRHMQFVCLNKVKFPILRAVSVCLYVFLSTWEINKTQVRPSASLLSGFPCS